MKKFWLLGIAALWAALAPAQSLSGISARWGDSFVEWELYTATTDTTLTDEIDASGAPDEELYGELKLRWLNLRDDWSEWDYQLGDERGTIKLKWKDDPTQWELRTYSGAIITMRAAWTNDLSEWRVTNNNISLTLRSRWTNQADEWLVQDDARGSFYLYTLREGDPRDWAIEDKLDASISQPMKMALVFLTVFQSSPRQ
ncbi:MAG: hypothetical protein IT260_22320 [Saprospiraceae bacterium]|nr:hypothetical protein [Saprospiraceae bacterium]